MPARRLVAVVLAALVGTVLVALPSQAATVQATVGEHTFQVDDANVAAGATLVSSTATGPSLLVPASVEISGVTYAVKQIYSDAFRNKGLTSVTIPEGIQYIQPYAFAENSLTTLTLPSSVTWLNTGAFMGNDITTLNLPEGLSNIGPGAFFDNALTSVVLPASVTIVNPNAFNANPALTDITFKGNAPLMSGTAPLGLSTTLVRHYADSTGFTAPTWAGGSNVSYTTEVIPLITVSFNANGHDVAPASSTVRPGNTVADPGPLSATGYDFEGWFTAASGGTQVTFPYTATEDVTLYAQWTVQEHPATFVLGNGEPDVTTQVAYSGSVTPSSSPTRTGHTFTGWFTAASGGTAVAFPYTVTEAVTFYAQWEPNEYTVTFAPQNGEAPTSQDADYNTTVVAPSAPTLVSHSFSGWFTAATGGTQVSFPYTITEDVTLYAQWERLPVHVTVPGQAAGGSTITVTGENYLPGEAIEIWLLSTPVQLASLVAGTDGTFSASVTIPTNVPAGVHSLEVRGAQTATVANAITITQVLAATGASESGNGWAALALVLSGVGLVALRHRYQGIGRSLSR